MSRVSNLATAIGRVPTGMPFTVRAVQKDIKSKASDEDGALFIHVRTSTRTDVIRVRERNGDGVCLGRVGFETHLPALQAVVVLKLKELGIEAMVPVLNPSVADGYNGVALAQGRGV